MPTGAAGSAFAGADVALSFSRIARAIRQIVALEQETLGLREAREGEVRTKRKHARRQSVRLAVKEAAETSHPDLDREELDGLLRDLFLDYDDYDDESEGGEAGIIARLYKALESQLDWAEDEPDLEAHEDRSQALDAEHDDENDFAEMLGRIGSDRPGPGRLSAPTATTRRELLLVSSTDLTIPCHPAVFPSCRRRPASMDPPSRCSEVDTGVRRYDDHKT